MQETTSQEVVSCGERSPHIPICYESLVGDMGSTLSGDQRQQVPLRRAPAAGLSYRRIESEP